MKYVMYRDRAGYYRWYLQASNGRKLADSGEGYHNRSDCISAVHLVMGAGSTTPFEEA